MPPFIIDVLVQKQLPRVTFSSFLNQNRYFNIEEGDGT